MPLERLHHFLDMKDAVGTASKDNDRGGAIRPNQPPPQAPDASVDQAPPGGRFHQLDYIECHTVKVTGTSSTVASV